MLPRPGSTVHVTCAPLARGMLRVRWRAGSFLLALACACVLFGAIPGYTVPTLTQAEWASGFAQSYANADTPTIYAHDFGLPLPAPIAFGLSATVVQGLVIRATGMRAIDAYTVTTVLYLALALYGATALARHLGSGYLAGLAAALLWIALPIVCLHVGFSMLSLGLALLPTYLYAAMRVVDSPSGSLMRAAVLVATCILAVFMDGYTFVMFFVASTIACAAALLDRATRKRTALFAVPVMAIGFGCAVFAYALFIGHRRFTMMGLDFHRGWGVDVSMLLVPTHGMHWLWDCLGIFEDRSEQIYWGDASIWMTTFVAPLLASAAVGYFLFENRRRAAVLLAIAVVGLYMSLGPSLKVYSTKQVPGISAEDAGPLMPEQYAIAPTGSAWVSEHVPGFREMRAAYRWEGLGALGLWALTLGLLIRLNRRHPFLAVGTAGLLAVMFAPHVGLSVRTAAANRAKILDMNTRLSGALQDVAKPGGVLFFAPHGNDFMVVYLAATSGFRTYNAGGDKNVEIARQAWPHDMQDLDAAGLASRGAGNIRRILLREQADAVVLPYFDSFEATYVWPVPQATVSARKAQVHPVAEAAAATPCFRLTETPLFVAVSLNDAGREQSERLRRDGSESGDAWAGAAAICGVALDRAVR